MDHMDRYGLFWSSLEPCPRLIGQTTNSCQLAQLAANQNVKPKITGKKVALKSPHRMLTVSIPASVGTITVGVPVGYTFFEYLISTFPTGSVSLGSPPTNSVVVTHRGTCWRPRTTTLPTVTVVNR